MDTGVNSSKRDDDVKIDDIFINQYNKEIDDAEAEIEKGDSLTQDQVEQLFADRRKKL